MPWLRRARLLGFVVGTLAVLLACDVTVGPAHNGPAPPKGIISRDPTDLIAGPDGNLWLTVPAMGRIGRIGVDGTISEFALPPDLAEHANLAWMDELAALAVGPDGALWLAVWGKRSSTVARLTTTGQVAARFPLDAGIQPYALAAGPDGNLWFTDPGGNRLGRMTPKGMVITFDLPDARVDVPVPSYP